MNRLDFSSAMAVIRYYISPDHGMSQGELLDELFYGLHAESNEPIIFDVASVNRWLKGTERVSPIISRYYLKRRNREKLTNDIEQYILPLMHDSDMAVQELYRLAVQDTTISDRKKNKLLKGYPCDTEQDAACLIAALLCFGMERTFVRRTPGNMALMATGSLSSASADFILNNHVPTPCRHFCGREEELSALQGLLNEHGKVFGTGIPGIGKSEIAKAYAKQHKAAICMDTAAIHEAMGNTYLMTGNVEQAAIQHRKCLTIYAELFPDQPDLLAAKQSDLRMLYEQVDG